MTDERKPVTPRPAASVVLMRRGGKHGQGALEVLLLQRSPAAAFFPGAWVFPGGACEPEDGEGPDGYRACAIRELREEAGIDLHAEEEMIPFCRCITPEVIPRRFDAWFFLALAPAHAPPRIDGGEIVDARWLRPPRRWREPTTARSASPSRPASSSAGSPNTPPRPTPWPPTAAARSSR